MFGLFKKKTYTHSAQSVTDVDKDWIEKNIIWFIETFGLNHLKDDPFILPTKEIFNVDNLYDGIQFQNLFEKICNYWGIDPNEIIVKFFDDMKSKQWSTWIYTENSTTPAGLFNQIYTTDEKRFKIEIAKSNLSNPALLVNVISHELGHVKLLGSNLIKVNETDMESLTDLSSIFFGFGIFMANTSITTDDNWMTKTGYFQSQIISYTNALLCYITEKNYEDYIPYLNENTKALFIGDSNYLKNTGDTSLDKWTVNNSVLTYTNNKTIKEAFKARDFEAVIEASDKLIKSTPKKFTLYNTLGYALLQQKKYEAAIVEFTKAVEIDPYYDYAYNNRGYCKLQLKDYDNAFPDIHSAFEMNPANSFAWRNLGLYYFLVEDFEKSLHYFEEAEKINPETEMINFYLGIVHSKLNNIEKSLYYSEKSKAKNEYNDSVIC
jgi:tetratricopeptide (TPR) repeat protein